MIIKYFIVIKLTAIYKYDVMQLWYIFEKDLFCLDIIFWREW